MFSWQLLGVQKSDKLTITIDGVQLIFVRKLDSTQGCFCCLNISKAPTATPFLVAGDTGPDGYIQVGTTTLANGTPTTLWAAEGAMGNA